MEKIDFNSTKYIRSRKAYVTQSTLEHLLGLLVLDAFLAKLLTYLGLTDAMVGIISSFTSVAFLFQLLSIFLVQSKFSTKKIVIAADVISQFFFMFIYFVPFIPVPNALKKIVVMVSVMIGQASKCIISSLYFKWANSYVAPHKRSVFSANKEIISLLCGIVFSAITGFVIDKFENIGNIKGGFLFIAVSMLIINIANYVSLKLIKDEDAIKRTSMRVSVKEVLLHIKGNKTYLNSCLIGFMTSISGGLIIGFMGVYKTKELAFGVLLVQVINIIADGFRMIASTPIAKYSAKYGYARGIELSNIMLLLAYLSVVFTTPQTRWLILVFTFLYTTSLAASYQNSFNISYTLLPQKYMAQAMAIKSTMGGIFSFGAAILAGKILSFIQLNGNEIFGIHIYAQQFLALLAFLIKIPEIVLYNKKVIKPINEFVLSEENADDN